MRNRFFKTSLSAMPDVKTAGAFGNSEERLAWVQPSDAWHVHWPSHAGTFTLNGHNLPFEPHAVIIVPPGARCEVRRFGRSAFVYCYCSFVPVESPHDRVSLPALTQLEPAQADWLEREFRRGLRGQQWSKTGLRAIVYALLWSVARPEFVLEKAVTTEAAERLIESRLGRRILIRELATELKVSQSQLARAFLQDHGRTPLQYVRDRRAELAYRLLTQTSTPIKQVAMASGFPDANQFYRFVKQRYGASPREIRKDRGNVDTFRSENLRAARAEE